ncbi:unnamed protein product [Effrenium voratum]|nr:unnamed protein product [Effrenium voratum]
MSLAMVGRRLQGSARRFVQAGRIQRLMSDTSTQDVAGGQSAPSSKRMAVLAASGVAVAAVSAASWQAWAAPGKVIDIDIKPISDEVFDNNDNLFVFYFDKAEDLSDRRDNIQRIIRAFIHEPSLAKVKYYQNVRKDGDPSLPGDAEDDKPIRVVMYKGQRKSILYIGDEIPKQEVLEFYKPVSQDLSRVKAPKWVPFVSNQSFQEDVLQHSPGRPMVLLQMYEDTCFLCFLMRPFINSLGELLQQIKAPFVVKRLNIEANDFPDHCPVARGTPTFALFSGGAPEKWEEFKPKDLCERIVKAFPGISDSVFDRMDELQSLVSRRFQLFTQLVMWTVELHKLEACLADAEHVRGPSEDSEFNSILSRLMAKDMRRVDGIEDNIAYLKQQVDEVEHDAVVMSIMLGKLVLAREAQEAQAQKAW